MLRMIPCPPSPVSLCQLLIRHRSNLIEAHSTPEQWDDLGRSLFGRKLYPQAASCFEKAGRPLEQDICRAYELHKQARESLTYHPNSFKTAAAEFRRCAVSSSQDLMAVRLHKKAGECFVEARDLLSAAESYTSALDFNMAARLYRKAGMFDKAVALVKPISGQPSQVDKKICDEIIQVAKFEYARNSNLKFVEQICGTGSILTQCLGRWPLFSKGKLTNS